MSSETLKALLIKQGANEQQVNSKVVRLCENAIADMSREEIDAITLQKVDDLRQEFEHAVRLYGSNVKRADEAFRGLSNVMQEAMAIEKGIESIVREIEIIPTEQSKQAIYLYKSVLQTTKEVFGEEIPEEVMKTAIQAGSYGMWRSIMGETKPAVNVTRY